MLLRFWLRGSAGATSGAKTAATSTIIRPVIPATMAGLAPRRRSVGRPSVCPRAAEGSVNSSVREVTSLTLAQPDARIEQGVEEVDDKVHQHEQERRDQDTSLDHREVTALQCIESQFADAGPVEDELHNV